MRAAYAGRTHKLYVNWGFGGKRAAEFRINFGGTRTRQRPQIPNYIKFRPVAPFEKDNTPNENNSQKKTKFKPHSKLINMFNTIDIDRNNLTIMGVRFSDLKTLESTASAIGSNMFEGFKPN